MTTERYRILKKLGEGGCGRTYLVRDRKLGKLWVMKEWKQEDAAGAAGESFGEKEFRILRDLDSPCFPRLVECFWKDGRRYLVMDWVRGMTLEEKLVQDGPPDWRQAADCALQLCGALEKLHGGKPAILHLDLKPSNIILTQDGPRLIDFGSAVLVEDMENRDQGKKVPAGKKRILTGTPGFAAPELYEGRAADAGSDVYSLGAVLQVMLTGKKPQPETEKPEGVPERLWEIAECALRKDRRERFSNAGEMKNALEGFLEDGEEKAGAGKQGRMAGKGLRAVLALLTAALSAFLYFSAVRMPREGKLQEGSVFHPGGQAVCKESIGSGKRLENYFQSSVWEFAGRAEEKGRLLGIRHFLGEAVRKRAEGEDMR